LAAPGLLLIKDGVTFEPLVLDITRGGTFGPKIAKEKQTLRLNNGIKISF
jgi:hypothetical protein